MPLGWHLSGNGKGGKVTVPMASEGRAAGPGGIILWPSDLTLFLVDFGFVWELSYPVSHFE